MARSIIEVDKVSKCYRLGEFNAKTLRDEIAQFGRRWRTEDSAPAAPWDLWALKDVSFAVLPAEVVGVIGRNGAGKSTLLKILSRVTEPTRGLVRMRGRVASLLEVGTGFHPDLTGRENVFLNGTILGMTRAEVTARFDEIVAFAEVERFIDTPVKRYSSGMYLRLAFAVAAHLEPEILIVDEVLAVGDAEFQMKCLGKMHDVSHRGGRTVLFVSHNMAAVASLCSRAILLDDGRIKASGSVSDVTSTYLGHITTTDDVREQCWNDIDMAPGDERVRIHRIRILSDADRVDSPLETHTPLRIVAEYWNLVEDANLIVEIIVRAADETPVFQSLSVEDRSASTAQPRGLLRTTCFVPAPLLNEGLFRAEIHFLHGSTSRYFSLKELPQFSIHDARVRKDLGYYGRFVGHVHPQLRWSTELIAPVANLA